MKATNPATGELIKDYPEFTIDQIADIIDRSDRTFKEWRKVDFGERSKLMSAAAQELRDNKQVYAELMTMEMGKIISESNAEVEKCAWVCEYYAEHAEQFLADEQIETDAGKSYVAYDPLGVILAVMPWNFPFWQVFRFAAPALMAGNAALLKHASNVPGCAIAIEGVFKNAGFPADLFKTLLISSDKVEVILKNPKVKAATLTGSEWAGKSVASIAGAEIKKTVLELGGSDPYIVLKDADMDKCIKTGVQARMINSGQSCIAAKRFLVVKSQLAEFESKTTELMSQLKTGDPMNPDINAGPLARPDLVDEIDKQVQESVKQGAKLLCGGKRIPGKGSYYEPTVLSGVKKGMPVFDEETFGPIMAIISVENEDEAIKLANDSQFGLGAALWTSDLKHAESLARQIESGAVFINGLVKSDPRMPFGGIKKSGFGRELSQFGIREFVNIKSIWIGK
jgi:succinate-semialdehyde dehydrogenase/glutarate-semialdehyde dehydrogenase